MRGNDFEAFKVLNAVIKYGGYKQAANVLNKTVPAISHNISQLEARYGLTLLDRSEYRVKLTKHGTRLLEEARRIIEQSNYLDSIAGQLNDNWEPSLEVVFDGLLEPDIILDVIAQIKEAGAPTTFQLTTEYLGGVEKRFAQDDADIMFTLEPSAHQAWRSEHLFDLEMILVGTPELGLKRKRIYEISELSNFLEISVQDSSYSDPVAGRSLGGPDLFYVGDFYTKKRAILKGIGIGWMPLHWVKAELQSSTLMEIHTANGSRDSYQVCVGTWKSRAAGKAQKEFIRRISESFR